MNKNENKKRLKQSMAMLKIKIENLKPHIETSERINSLYNKLLIEKAILKKEHDDFDKKQLGIFQKISNFVRSKNKKLISDYFN